MPTHYSIPKRYRHNAIMFIKPKLTTYRIRTHRQGVFNRQGKWL